MQRIFILMLECKGLNKRVFFFCPSLDSSMVELKRILVVQELLLLLVSLLLKTLVISLNDGVC